MVRKPLAAKEEFWEPEDFAEIEDELSPSEEEAVVAATQAEWEIVEVEPDELFIGEPRSLAGVLQPEGQTEGRVMPRKSAKAEVDIASVAASVVRSRQRAGASVPDDVRRVLYATLAGFVILVVGIACGQGWALSGLAASGLAAGALVTLVAVKRS
jgi:hypothetical protein